MRTKMRRTIPQTALSFVLFVCLLSGCKSKEETPEPTPQSTSEIEAIIEAKVDSFYKVYERFDYAWIDFFEEEFTNVFPDTPIRKISKDSTKAIWESIYSKYDVQLLERGKPSFISSQDMVISHNHFNEIFINKETGDTIKNEGTYVIAWRRQTNDNWKIVFESVHNN